jgi:hypothetical protein
LLLRAEEVIALPLSERKAALAHLLKKAKPGIRYSEHISGDGSMIFKRACMMDLEGCACKRRCDSGVTVALMPCGDAGVSVVGRGRRVDRERRQRDACRSGPSPCDDARL